MKRLFRGENSNGVPDQQAACTRFRHWLKVVDFPTVRWIKSSSQIFSQKSDWQQFCVIISQFYFPQGLPSPKGIRRLPLRLLKSRRFWKSLRPLSKYEKTTLQLNKLTIWCENVQHTWLAGGQRPEDLTEQGSANPTVCECVHIACAQLCTIAGKRESHARVASLTAAVGMNEHRICGESDDIMWRGRAPTNPTLPLPRISPRSDILPCMSHS